MPSRRRNQQSSIEDVQATTSSSNYTKHAVHTVFSIESYDITKRFDRWLMRLESAFSVFEIPEGKKSAYLLHYMGSEAYNTLCDTISPEKPDDKTFKDIVDILLHHYNPEPLEIAEIFRFLQRKQQEGETVQEYLTTLRKLATTCNFENYLQKALRNQFVFGLRSQDIQSRLLEIRELTLENALAIAKSIEMSARDAAELHHSKNLSDLNQLNQNTKNKKNISNINVSKTNSSGFSRQNFINKKLLCFRCGSDQHLANRCDKRHVVCDFCKIPGHLTNFCMKNSNHNQTHQVEETTSDVEEILAVEHPEFRNKFMVTLKINEISLEIEADTGAAPCPESSPTEFREQQCAAHNNVLYEGGLYKWQPYYDDDEPCALKCKGKATGDEDDDAILIIAQLKDKVHDGTRCRPGNLDMCIDGKCQRMGCDLKIGSLRQVDECGVCGGDGASCSRPLYHWTLTYASLCSATCGGGYKMSRPVCQNRVSGDEVEEELCNDSQKPKSTVVACNTHACPPKWYTGEWGQCTVSCGGGSRTRQVYCVEETNNSKIQVADSKCGGPKPWSQMSCNTVECPLWYTTKWSGCSVSCGQGVQMRDVKCRDSNDHDSSLCDPSTKPDSTQICSTGIQCPVQLETSEELLPGLYHTQPLIQPYPPPQSPQKLVGGVPNESTFIPEEWGPCSASCDEGIRKREVNCKIFLEFSKTVVKLPDDKCSGPKPAEVEACFNEPCNSEAMAIGVDIKDDPYRQDNIKVGAGNPARSYSWKEQGFSPCSASCLGGVQELIVNCVRDDTQKITSPFMCQFELKPEIIVRACNEQACPPRWQFTEFSKCSQNCGLGIQTREVTCIHELTGAGNPMILPPARCPQPAPLDRQYCNVLDCPVRWKVSEWSKCTQPCGGGEKSRKVECKQVLAQNHTVDRPSSMCPSPRPLETKSCNTKSCSIDTDKPEIDFESKNYTQTDPKQKTFSVKVGGVATLFYGTTVKIRCPVKRYDRTKIVWKKDNFLLSQTKKYRISKKSALKITNLTYKDSGLYSCIAGKSIANIKIIVRQRPGEFQSSEEIQRLYNKQDVAADDGVQKPPEPLNFDEHSHEQRPDGLKKKFKPTTASSLHLDHMNQVENRANGDEKKQGFWPFPNLGISRGHRTVEFPQLHQKPQDYDFYSERPLVHLTLRDEPVIIEDNLKEIFNFEWTVTNWSRCSVTCGGNGFQYRDVRCLLKMHNGTHEVHNSLCEDAGLAIPNTSQRCGFDSCPEWITSEWTVCEKSKCFSMHKAWQKRVVKCKEGNQTVDSNKCDLGRKPSQRHECYNEKCVGKWKVGPWSQCPATCDSEGEKHRIIQCVWHGTKKPAGTACIDLKRPPVSKGCKGPPCSNNLTAEPCRDHSMFCSNVKALNMCRIVRYKQQCCQTCKEED